MRPRTHRFAEAAGIPNNPRLPVLVYPGVLSGAAPEDVEARFLLCGWGGGWRDGIFAFHHFHSTAHEALAIARGSVRVALGGPAGEEVELRAGDVAVLPAGTGHRNVGARDLLVIGAYPPGQRPDLLRAGVDLAAARARIAAVPLPASDPVLGGGGPLPRLWGSAATSG